LLEDLAFCVQRHQRLAEPKGTDAAHGSRQAVASAIQDPAGSCVQLHHDFLNKILAFGHNVTVDAVSAREALENPSHPRENTRVITGKDWVHGQ
jgi:hypothetical protein